METARKESGGKEWTKEKDEKKEKRGQEVK